MHKINNEFNENIYTYTTASGLMVNIVHRPGFKESMAIYGTPFGALNIKQMINNEEIVHKSGVAHFLEHKLFEDEHEDILSQFSKMGASANAFTSYEQTMYYFKFNGSIIKPLELLINFVSSLNITEESVEKEKGIIIEEIKMYEQMADMRLINETYRNLFHYYPFIYDIAGTPESVSATTRHDLEMAYKLNYADSNMCLTVISHEDPEIIKSIIDVNTQSHATSERPVKNIFETEPTSVVHAFREIEDNVEVPKMSVAYKFPYQPTSTEGRLRDEFLLKMVMELNFSEFNDSYQDWLDEEIISDQFVYDVDLRDGFGVIYFMNETEKPNQAETIIKQTMHALTIKENEFNQLLKRYYGEMIMSLSKIEDYAILLTKSYFDGINYTDYLSMIRNLNASDVAHVYEIIARHEISVLLMNKIQP